MSQRILNSRSESYWWGRDWHPAHMGWEWLEAELRVFDTGSEYLNLPRKVRRSKSCHRRAVRHSRRINRLHR